MSKDPNYFENLPINYVKLLKKKSTAFKKVEVGRRFELGKDLVELRNELCLDRPSPQITPEFVNSVQHSYEDETLTRNRINELIGVYTAFGDCKPTGLRLAKWSALVMTYAKSTKTIEKCKAWINEDRTFGLEKARNVIEEFEPKKESTGSGVGDSINLKPGNSSVDHSKNHATVKSFDELDVTVQESDDVDGDEEEEIDDEPQQPVDPDDTAGADQEQIDFIGPFKELIESDAGWKERFDYIASLPQEGRDLCATWLDAKEIEDEEQKEESFQLSADESQGEQETGLIAQETVEVQGTMIAAGRDVEFDHDFWAKYPNKQGKNKAKEVWNGLNRNERIQFVDAMNRYIDFINGGGNGGMFKNGCTFANNWRDYGPDFDSVVTQSAAGKPNREKTVQELGREASDYAMEQAEREKEKDRLYAEYDARMEAQEKQRRLGRQDARPTHSLTAK